MPGLFFGPICSHFTDFWAEANLDCTDVADSAPEPPGLTGWGEVSIWVSHFLADLRLITGAGLFGYVPRLCSSGAFFSFESNNLDEHTYYFCSIRIIYRLNFFCCWFGYRLFFSQSFFTSSARGRRRSGPRREMHRRGGFSLLRSAHGGARRGKLSCGTSRIRDGGRWAFPGSCSRRYVVLPLQRQLLLDFVCSESNDGRLLLPLHRVRPWHRVTFAADDQAPSSARNGPR